MHDMALLNLRRGWCGGAGAGSSSVQRCEIEGAGLIGVDEYGSTGCNGILSILYGVGQISFQGLGHTCFREWGWRGGIVRPDRICPVAWS